jgi:YhcH/YjgK/YiaL family protein
MVLDTLPHSGLAGRLGPRFDAALAWLTRFDPHTPDGKYPIDGEAIFALVQSYATVPAAEKRFEAHRAYIELQYVVAGTERMLYAPLSEMRAITDYDPQNDYQLFADSAAASTLRLSPGSFAIFFPHDAHKPGCSDETPGQMKKVVITIQVS